MELFGLKTGTRLKCQEPNRYAKGETNVEAVEASYNSDDSGRDGDRSGCRAEVRVQIVKVPLLEHYVRVVGELRNAPRSRRPDRVGGEE